MERVPVSRLLDLSRAVLRALAGAPASGREVWLRKSLDLARTHFGASAAVLGEFLPRGCLRSFCDSTGLVTRADEKVRGLPRALFDRQAVLLENDARASLSFRREIDGWRRDELSGHLSVVVPGHHPRRAWLSLLRSETDRPFVDEDLPAADFLAETLAMALQQEARWRDLETLAMTDGLTHIPNYRFLRLALDRELELAARHGGIFTVAMVDVDHLKQYNQAHGHLRGSELLRRIAQCLRKETRASDVVTRYGGDEFLLILPKTDGAGALVLCDRLRARLAEGLLGAGGEAMSCSFGIATFPRDGTEFVTLLSAADRALSRAKEEGRNVVVCPGV